MQRRSAPSRQACSEHYELSGSASTYDGAAYTTLLSCGQLFGNSLQSIACLNLHVYQLASCLISACNQQGHSSGLYINRLDPLNGSFDLAVPPTFIWD